MINSEDIPIQPTKVVKPSKPQETSDPDTKEARTEYDSRLYSAVSLDNEVMHYGLFSYFDFDNDDKQSNRKNEKLKTIYKWSKDRAKSDDISEVIRHLHDLDLKLGIPSLGVSRLNHYYQYIKIENQIEEKTQERIMKYGC